MLKKNISTDCFLINCVKISLISLYYFLKKLGMVSYFWRSSWKTLKFLEPNHLDDSVLKHSCIENIYIKSAAGKKRTISPFLRTTIFRWCEKNFFSRRKGCGSFFIHLGRRWSYPIFNFKTNESSRNFCGGGSCYTWQWEFHHHTPRYGVVYTITLVVVPITSWFSSTSHQWHWKNSRII